MKKKQRIILMPQRNADYKGLDYYPTPPWATKAIMEKLDLPRGTHIWEPACGEKHMSNVMEDYGHKVWSTDVFDYGQGKRHVYDFENLTVQLGDRALEPPTPEWIITNPPFKLADKFILNALDIATSGVAMLCRLMLLEGSGRYGRVFSKRPPTTVHVFSERVSMVKGKVDPNVSGVTCHAWFVWKLDEKSEFPRIEWIKPGTKARLSNGV